MTTTGAGRFYWALRGTAVVACAVLLVGLFSACDNSLDEQYGETGDSEVNPDVDAINVSMSPADLPADGQSEASVSARVTHKGVAVKGASVVLSALGGGVFKQNKSTSISGRTDGNGTFASTLVAGLTPGRYSLLARVGFLGAGTEFALTGSGPALSVEFRGESKYADGNTSVPVVATLTASGRYVAGKRILFEASRGCFDDLNSAGGRICPVEEYTNEFGQASVNLVMPLLPIGTKDESITVIAKVSPAEDFVAPDAVDHLRVENIGYVDVVDVECNNVTRFDNVGALMCTNLNDPNSALCAEQVCNIYVRVRSMRKAPVDNVWVTFAIEGPGEIRPTTALLTDRDGIAWASLQVDREPCGSVIGVTATAGKDAVCDFCARDSTAHGRGVFVSFITEVHENCDTEE
ncbi:MAG: carboxypeptidase regulatory-like domain-containing protein [Candidatus Schekmanbacteria bacterium]|nr:carboxypeptidase regulatory-like domain-containing protein [Candidatus Schekmanbacteria bacterium]